MKVVSFRGQEFHFPDETPDDEISAEMRRVGDEEAGFVESVKRIPSDLATGYQKGLRAVAGAVDELFTPVGPKQTARGAIPAQPTTPVPTRDMFGRDFTSNEDMVGGDLVNPSPHQLVRDANRSAELDYIANLKRQAQAESNPPLDIFGAQSEIAKESQQATEAAGFSRPMVSSIAQSVSQMVPVVAAGMAPGVGFPAALALGGLQQAIPAYEEAKSAYRSQGLPEEEASSKAYHDAVVEGGITVATESLFGPLASKIAPRAVALATGGNKFVGGAISKIMSNQSIRAAVIEETGSEISEQVLQDLYEKFRSRPDMTLGEFLSDTAQAGLGAAVGAGVWKVFSKTVQRAVTPRVPEATRDNPKTAPAAAAVKDIVAKTVDASPAAAGVVAGMSGTLTDNDVDTAMGQHLVAGTEQSPGNIAADTTSEQPGPVMPDSPDTINAQMRDALDSDSTRKGVLLSPRGDGWEPEVPSGLDYADTPHGVVLFNPEKTTHNEAVAAGSGDNFNATFLGMSQSDRPAGGQTPGGLNLTTSGRDGTPDVLSEQVTQDGVTAAKEAAAKSVPGGDSVLTTNEELLRQRALRDEAANLAAQRGDGPKSVVVTPESSSTQGETQATTPQPPASAPALATAVDHAAISEAIDQSDVGRDNVDIVPSDAPYDVAYDPATKRFIVNPNKVKSAESVTLKLNTHEKLHFVVDALREQGRDAEALKLIEAMASQAPDDLIRQIQKYYAGSTTGELTEEQAAYASQQLAKHFARKGWFQRLTEMVSKVLSSVTGDKRSANRIAAEMAAGRIQKLSEEFMQQRRDGTLPKGELKMSRPEVMVPTQRFGVTEQDIKHERAVFADIRNKLAVNYMAPWNPVTPENDAKFWQVAGNFADPVRGIEFSNQVNKEGGSAASAALLQATLAGYAWRAKGMGNPSLYRFMQDTALVMKPGTAESSTELGQMLRALQETGIPGASTRSIEAAQVRAISDWLDQHKSPDGTASIGTDLLKKLMRRLFGQGVTFDDMVVDPDKGTKVYRALNKLLGIGTRRESEETRRLINDPTTQAQRVIDKLTVERPGRKVNKTALMADIAGALKIGEGTDPVAMDVDHVGPFVDKWKELFKSHGVTPYVARELAFTVSLDRMRRQANLTARSLARAGAGRNEAGNFKGSDVGFLMKEIMANPLLAQNNPQWRFATAVKFYLNKGLPLNNAQAAATLFEYVFRNQLADAQFEAAKKVVEENRDVDGNVKLNSLDKIRAAIRSQISNPDATFAEALAEQYGFKSPFTKAQFNELAEIDAKYNESTRHEQAILTRRMNSIARQSSLKPTIRERVASYYVINALSGIKTFMMNALGPFPDMTSLAGAEATRSLTQNDPVSGIGQTMAMAVHAFNQIAKEMLFSAQQDAYVNLDIHEISKFNIMADQTANALRDVQNTSLNPIRRLGSAVSGTLGLLDVFRRSLSSLDNTWSAGVRDFVETVGVRDGYRGTGMNTKQAYAVATASRLAAPQFIAEGNALGLDGVRLTMYVEDRIRDSMFTQAATAGVDADAIQREAQNALELSTGNYPGREMSAQLGHAFDLGTPPGRFAETLVSGLEGIVKEHPLVGRMIFGFLRVPFNRGNYLFNYTGAGLARLAYQYAAEKSGGRLEIPYAKSLATPLQKFTVGTQGAVGLAAIAALGYLLKDALTGKRDDKDEWIVDATAGQIPSENDRKLMLANGLDPSKPNIFLRNKKTGEVRKIQASSGILEPFAWHVMVFGAVRDWQRQGKPLSETQMENLGTLMGQVVLGASRISRNFGASNASDLMHNISTAKGAASTAGFSLSGFMPAGSLVNSVRRLNEDKPSRETAASAFWSSFAYAPPDARKPALNWLGHPVQGEYDGTMAKITDRMVDVGMPFGVRLPASDKAWPLYKMMLEKGATPTAYSIGALQTRIGRTVTPDEYRDYVNMRGNLTDYEMHKNFSTLQSKPTEEFNKLIDIYSAKAGVAAELKIFNYKHDSTKKVKVEKAPLFR